MSKKYPGLILRNGVWHIDKKYKHAPGGRICKSTTFSKAQEAEAGEYLNFLIEQFRQSALYGERPNRTFREAATKFLNENDHLDSLSDIAIWLSQLDPYVGDLPLHQVHDETLQPFIEDRRKEVKTKTINNALQVVRRILNLAARSWRDKNGLTWLNTSPKITMLKVNDAAKPYPLGWDEQRNFFVRLPAHLQRMALFKVNTGNREDEVCNLQWSWEVPVPELETSVFVIPGNIVKNEEDRLVVLNRVAKAVIEELRLLKPTKHLTKCKQQTCNCAYCYVFTYNGFKVNNIHNNAWKRAWKDAGLPVSGSYMKGVHNLKHTFGRRLRAAGVPLETRKVLLGHKNGDITTHYSGAELEELIQAADKIYEVQSRKTPALTLVKLKAS